MDIDLVDLLTHVDELRASGRIKSLAIAVVVDGRDSTAPVQIWTANYKPEGESLYELIGGVVNLQMDLTDKIEKYPKEETHGID